MGVPLISTAGITASATFIAEREARRLLEKQVTRALGIAGELIPQIFAALRVGRRGTGPEIILRDLISTGTLAPEKIEILQGLKPIDLRRLTVRLQEWAQEIVAPGTGQPVIAMFGVLPEERGRLRPATTPKPTGGFRFRGLRAPAEPILLAGGAPLLEVPGLGRALGPRRRPAAELEKFRQKAADIRRLAERRGLL